MIRGPSQDPGLYIVTCLYLFIHVLYYSPFMRLLHYYVLSFISHCLRDKFITPVPSGETFPL